ETLFSRTFKNQILAFRINITRNVDGYLTEKIIIDIFTYILNTFTNVRYLNYDGSSIYYPRLSFDISPPMFTSSNLLELHVGVNYFTDILYLCDGRFNQLHTLYVNVYQIQYPNLIIDNTVDYFLINI
ncbi:unnamed protein product, partial [Rotaria sp. Silwood2]